MRAFAWSCVVGGILLVVGAFIITANTPLNPVAHARGRDLPDSGRGRHADDSTGSLT